MGRAITIAILVAVGISIATVGVIIERSKLTYIGSPKIDTPKIDAFFKLRALLKCVNLWRTTVSMLVTDVGDNC